MEQNSKKSSRKKFLLWGSAALSSFGLLKYISGNKKKSIKTVKMLTEDGKLVEVDIASLKRSGNKISDTAIHDWIKPQQNS